MKALALALSLLLCSSCSILDLSGWLGHPVDYNSRNYGEINKDPRVQIRLGQSSAICLPPGEPTAQVDIFIDLINIPVQDVRVVINDSREIYLYGKALHIYLQKVGPGGHYADVYIPGVRPEPYRVTWAVYFCPPVERGELYKPDGHGLRGYCPEPTPCECTTPQ